MKIRFPGNELDYKPDWKSMKLSDKAGYIWDYYKIPIAIALVMIYLAGYFCYRYVTRKYPVLYVDAVNLTLGEDLSGALADGYKGAAGLQPGGRDARFRRGSFSNRSGSQPRRARVTGQRLVDYSRRRGRPPPPALHLR